jgi:hypothetical protein
MPSRNQLQLNFSQDVVWRRFSTVRERSVGTFPSHSFHWIIHGGRKDLPVSQVDFYFDVKRVLYLPALVFCTFTQLLGVSATRAKGFGQIELRPQK